MVVVGRMSFCVGPRDSSLSKSKNFVLVHKTRNKKKQKKLILGPKRRLRRLGPR
jgi:hypothetical protein